MNKIMKAKFIIAALVAIITFIVFLPTLQNEFVWDDGQYIDENPFIHAINAKLFRSAFLGYYASNWHPLTWISHAIDCAFWGLNPLGHHLTNIILHALNTFMVVSLVIRLMEVFRRQKTSNSLSGSFLNNRAIPITGAVTGLLFGLHPLHVESVAWVAQRKDLLCALFFLLCITMYTKYVNTVDNETAQNKSVSRFFNKQYLFAIGFFILALLSKPMAISLPFVLLILDWYPFKRIRSLKTFGIAFVEKFPFIVLGLVSSILTIHAQRIGGAIIPIEIIPLSTRVPVAVKSLIAYLWKMILPLNLSPFYPYPEDVPLLSLEYLLPFVILIGITTICVVTIKKHKLWLSVWSYYVLTLIPVLGIVQVGSQAMADRYTYLPSLGPFFIAGLIAAEIYEKVTSLVRFSLILRMLCIVVANAAFISLSYVTIQQIGVWKNSLVFWNYVVGQESRRVFVVHNNLGVVYQSKGLSDMAMEQYQIALSLNPYSADVHNNLGVVYQSKGLYDMAKEQYQIALSLNPYSADAHNNLGVVYQSKGLYDMAKEQYQMALSLNPDYAEAHFNLGAIYLNNGIMDMARREFELGLKIKPNDYRAQQVLNDIIAK